jgi:hypothetical protein
LIATSVALTVPERSILSFFWIIVSTVAVAYSSRYMRDFWAKKAKIPLVDDYNHAIEDSVNVIGLLDLLVVGWGVLLLFQAIGL